MIADAEFKSLRSFQHDAFAVQMPAADLRKHREQFLVRLHALGRALAGAHHLGLAFRQRSGLDLHGRIGHFYPTGYGPAPQINSRIAVRLDGQKRHPLSRTHRRGIEQEVLIEWKRLGRNARPTRPKYENRGNGAAHRNASRHSASASCFTRARAVRSNRSSRPGAPTSRTPIGRPSLLAKSGRLRDGNPTRLQSEQKTGSPVASSPSGAMPLADGVMIASANCSKMPSIDRKSTRLNSSH